MPDEFPYIECSGLGFDISSVTEPTAILDPIDPTLGPSVEDRGVQRFVCGYQSRRVICLSLAVIVFR